MKVTITVVTVTCSTAKGIKAPISKTPPIIRVTEGSNSSLPSPDLFSLSGWKHKVHDALIKDKYHIDLTSATSSLNFIFILHSSLILLYSLVLSFSYSHFCSLSFSCFLSFSLIHSHFSFIIDEIKIRLDKQRHAWGVLHLFSFFLSFLSLSSFSFLSLLFSCFSHIFYLFSLIPVILLFYHSLTSYYLICSYLCYSLLFSNILYSLYYIIEKYWSKVLSRCVFYLSF